MKSTWSQGQYWFPSGRHASTTDMKDTSCTSSYNGTHPGSQYHKTFWCSEAECRQNIQVTGCCFWHPLLAAPDYCHNWASKMTFCVWLSVCVCVRDPELVNLKWKRLFPRSANALLQCGFSEGLDQGIFWDVLSYCIRIIAPAFNPASLRFSQVDSSVSCATFDIPHHNSSSHQVFCQWFGLSETCCWSETLEGPMREELTSG